MSYSVQNIRNVCLLGHGGNGKTALAESMLYLTGGTVRLGNPADGNTVCDYDPEEIRRQISISTAVAPVEYNGCKINVLDTPGYFDFSGEVIEALQVADAAIIVCSAKDGVSVGLEKAWKYCEERNMPRFIYISKTDEDNSDYNATFEALRARFGNKIAPLVVPIWDEGKKVTGIIDVLNKHFQVTLNVSKAQSGLIQAAYFGAYFVVAIPAGLFMEWKGYKAGILCGLSLYAIGALLFVPAAGVASFTFFLFALFVIALGLGCLETAANSYSSALGSTETAETRLNLSQSFNGLGQFTGPLLGGLLFFGGDEASGGGGLDAVRMTYVGIACVVILLVILFAKAELPDLRSSEEADEAAMMKHSLLAHKEFVAGVAAQFLYVAAQVGIGAFFINLYIECWPGGTAQQGAFFLSIAMLCLLIGRFVSTGIMTKIAPAKLLAAYGAECVILTGVVFTAVEYVSVIALIAVFFFISIMFPTIFAMGTKNLGTRKKLGGSYMIMAIVGGAIMPYFMGLIADYTHTAAAFLLPLCCFVCVVLYGAAYGRLVKE